MCIKTIKSDFNRKSSAIVNGAVKDPNNLNYEIDSIFSAKNSSVDLDIWSRFEYKMISGVVNVLEFASLFFGLTVALFSILKPQIKGGFYSLFVLLPLSIFLSVFFTHAEAKEDGMDD